jgi:hypothetical protein
MDIYFMDFYVGGAAGLTTFKPVLMANSIRVRIPWRSVRILAFFILFQHAAAAKPPHLFIDSKISAGHRSFFYIWMGLDRFYDGIVTGSGTQQDPFLIKANYFYYGLSVDEFAGFMEAIAAYNNGGKAFAIKTKDSTVYVRFDRGFK